MPVSIPPSNAPLRRALRAGFTLVEMAIVLVIVGLIAGSIMVGQTLIRSSELQSVLRETSNFIAITNAFQSRFGGLPGDITNATMIWGKDNANCSGATGVVTTRGTCNGNGDGKITTGWNGSNTTFPEMFRFWQQLSLAGLLKGQYSGVTGANSAAEFIGGVNAPISRWRNGTYGIWYANTSDAPATASSQLYAGNYGTFLIFGRDHTTGHPWGPILTPNDAATLDTKTDDGRPGLGKIVSNNTASFGNAGACADSNTADTANYVASDNIVSCILMFRQSL